MTSLNQNQFGMSNIVGTLDLHFNNETISSVVDASASGSASGYPLLAGQSVMVVDSLSAIPTIVPCQNNTDEVFGFIIFDRMNVEFKEYSRCEIAQAGNVIHLVSTTAITRGEELTLDLSAVGGVASAVGSDTIVGYALDKASGAGVLIRVKLTVPSFKTA